MTVSITWSSTAGGAGIASLNHGTSANGNNTTAQEIFIRHNGVNPITACGFYFAQKSGSYTGSATAADDFTEMIAWGDDNDTADFGGIQINMDKEGSFSGGSTWGMSEAQKTSVDNLKFTVRTGVGNSLANAVTLSEKMGTGMTTNGEIPASTNVSFQLRIKVPSSENVAGTRQFDQVLKYTYTS
jgi:hypothetical protein